MNSYINIYRKFYIYIYKYYDCRVNEFLQSNVRMVTYHKADDVLFDVTSYRSRKEVTQLLSVIRVTN